MRMNNLQDAFAYLQFIKALCAKIDQADFNAVVEECDDDFFAISEVIDLLKSKTFCIVKSEQGFSISLKTSGGRNVFHEKSESFLRMLVTVERNAKKILPVDKDCKLLACVLEAVSAVIKLHGETKKTLVALNTAAAYDKFIAENESLNWEPVYGVEEDLKEFFGVKVSPHIRPENTIVSIAGDSSFSLRRVSDFELTSDTSITLMSMSVYVASKKIHGAFPTIELDLENEIFANEKRREYLLAEWLIAAI